MLPAYSNEVISVLQASAIASVVTVMDLTGVARVIIARTFAPYEIFITIAVIYLALTYLIDFGFRGVEHRLSGHLRDRPAEGAKASLVPGLR
jgi:ABC-type arginine/histidine transport system permease subunit